MCNSSFQLTNSTSLFDESLNWYCNCKGYFGPHLLLTTSVLCFIVGMPVHCWSLWVSLRGNIKPNLVFPLNITIMELLFSIQSLVDLIDVRFPSLIGYRIANFLISVSWTVRPIIQICMCIEQYLAVIHPVTFLRYKSIHSRIALAGAAWIIAAGNSLRQMFIGIEYFRDHVFFVFFCIAVIIVSFCCVSVLCALKRPGPSDRHNVEMTEKDRGNKTDRGRTGENKQKRKAFRIISHILVSILVCYVPLVTAYFMDMFQTKRLLYICEAVPSVLSFTMITILLSPIIRMCNENHLKLMMCFSNLRQNK